MEWGESQTGRKIGFFVKMRILYAFGPAAEYECSGNNRMDPVPRNHLFLTFGIHIFPVFFAI